MDQFKKLQDCDGHWYWIPLDLEQIFNNVLDLIRGRDYMDAPDEFDYFNETFEKFRTLGDPDNIPEYFKNKSDE